MADTLGESVNEGELTVIEQLGQHETTSVISCYSRTYCEVSVRVHR